jgi:hypothetical protein
MWCIPPCRTVKGTCRRRILAGYGPPPKPLICVFLFTHTLDLPHDEESRVVHQAYCGAHRRSDPTWPAVTHIYHILQRPWCHAVSQLQPPPTHTRQLLTLFLFIFSPHFSFRVNECTALSFHAICATTSPRTAAYLVRGRKLTNMGELRQSRDALGRQQGQI